MCPKSGYYSGQGAVYECNVCRRERTEAEFMTELEDMEDDGDSNESENEDYLYDDTNDINMDTD